MNNFLTFRYRSFFSSVDCHTHADFLKNMQNFFGHVHSGTTKKDRLITLTKLGMKVVGECNQPQGLPHEHEDPCGTNAGHEFFDCPQITIDVPFKYTLEPVILVDFR